MNPIKYVTIFCPKCNSENVEMVSAPENSAFAYRVSMDDLGTTKGRIIIQPHRRIFTFTCEDCGYIKQVVR